jgi:hypothetical protein
MPAIIAASLSNRRAVIREAPLACAAKVKAAVEVAAAEMPKSTGRKRLARAQSGVLVQPSNVPV